MRMPTSLQISVPAAGIVLIALNRPDSANALNTALAQSLADALLELHENRSCRVAILTGSAKHFCAGADLKERQGMSEKDWHIQHDAFEKALHALLKCPIPVIAAVNGAAMGGGLELALAADFIYAADTARFALTEATLGIMPGLGGTQNLPRSVGRRRAKELLFTGQAFSAQQALEWGMVNAVFPTDQLMSETQKTAAAIAANAPLSLRAIKQSVDDGIALPLKEALAFELTHYRTLLTTKDRHEGITAWKEKRKPGFTGS